MSDGTDLLAARWAARHPGYEVRGGILGGWLRLMWRLARPLARAGVSPDLVTLASAGCAAAGLLAPPGARGPLLVAGSVADGLDGAVAVLADRTSAHGTRIDHAADRVADLAAAGVLLRSGAPVRVVAPGLVLTAVLEFARTADDGVVTVGERPSRVVCGALGDVASRVTGRRWPAVVAALVWDGLAAAAVAQLVAARRGRRTAR